MNCERRRLQVNAELDHELAPAEQFELQEHLELCEDCRHYAAEVQMIDDTLKKTWLPPSASSFAQRVLTSLFEDPAIDKANASAVRPIIESSTASKVSGHGEFPQKSYSRRSSAGVLLSSIICVLLLCALLFSLPVAAPAVAEITLSKGSIDLLQGNSTKWMPVSDRSRVPLSANARIRTGPNSLCEIRTRSDALVRVNHESELVFQGTEHVQLVSGEIWCRAPSTSALEISSHSIQLAESEEAVLSCPPSSETQWQTTSQNEIRCVAVTSTPIELKVPLSPFNCTVMPGESLSFAGDHPPKPTGWDDRLMALNWQLPLLALRDPHDPELQQRLTQLLAQAGHSKISYLYENQIRQLGAAGTIPLIAFVRSADSVQQPELRFRAMQIIADLAPASSLPDLKELLQDPQPAIRRLAMVALNRLTSQRETGP